MGKRRNTQYARKNRLQIQKDFKVVLQGTFDDVPIDAHHDTVGLLETRLSLQGKIEEEANRQREDVGKSKLPGHVGSTHSFRLEGMSMTRTPQETTRPCNLQPREGRRCESTQRHSYFACRMHHLHMSPLLGL